MATAIAVSVDTVDLVVGSLPRPARLAFNFAARLRRGTLEAVLPNGQRYLFGGAEPGPAATMIINNLDSVSYTHLDVYKRQSVDAVITP